MHTTSTRLVRNLSAAVVAGIAAWSSYRHMVTVALNVGEQPEVAYVLPLSVDGMLVVASVAMVDDRRSGRTVRWSARLAFTIGVLASLAANVSAVYLWNGAANVLLAQKGLASPVAGYLWGDLLAPENLLASCDTWLENMKYPVVFRPSEM